MRWPFAFILGSAACVALAAGAPVEIDPNTKTQGGADVRDSDAAAGGRSNPKQEADKARVDERGEVVIPDKQDSEKDKPISARKPHDEHEPEAARGESKQ